MKGIEQETDLITEAICGQMRLPYEPGMIIDSLDPDKFEVTLKNYPCDITYCLGWKGGKVFAKWKRIPNNHKDFTIAVLLMNGIDYEYESM